MIENLCRRSIVLLYCNLAEISNDSLAYKLQQLQGIYKTLMILDLSQRELFQDFVEGANSLLVTTGTSNQWHRFEYELCKSVECKTFAIQHGLSQEGITRSPEYHFSADHVLTWVKGEHILKDATTPKEKFIPVGVPDHYYDEYTGDKVDKLFFFTSFFDVDNPSDEKISRGIYTEQWKDKTWSHINELCSGDTQCHFVRHSAVERSNLHPTFRKILKRKNKTIIDNSWIRKNSINRSQLYSFGSEYYVTYPSSTFIDCLLNDLDYNLFVDYNGKNNVLSKDSLESVNATNKICNLLLS